MSKWQEGYTMGLDIVFEVDEEQYRYHSSLFVKWICEWTSPPKCLLMAINMV